MKVESIIVNGVTLRVGDRVRFTALPKHCDDEYASIYRNSISLRRSHEIKMISYGKALVFVRVITPNLYAIYTLPIDGQDENWIKVKRRRRAKKSKSKSSPKVKRKTQRKGWVSEKIIGYVKKKGSGGDEPFNRCMD